MGKIKKKYCTDGNKWEVIVNDNKNKNRRTAETYGRIGFIEPLNMDS
jgi:hypothetical protein